MYQNRNVTIKNCFPGCDWLHQKEGEASLALHLHREQEDSRRYHSSESDIRTNFCSCCSSLSVDMGTTQMQGLNVYFYEILDVQSYFLSSCSKFWRVKWWHHIYFFQNTSSGSVCCNDVIVQLSVETLPFGGIGESGYGSYHGKILETYEPFHKLWLYWNIVLYFLSRGHPN